MPRRKPDPIALADPIQDDVRKRRVDGRFGSAPRCFLCGEARPERLMRVTRKFLEMHHVVGAANAPELVVPLCLNCHFDITSRYRTAGVSMDDPEALLDRLLAALRAFSVFFPMVGDACGAWATQLAVLIEWFDRHLPGWRDFKGGSTDA